MIESGTAAIDGERSRRNPAILPAVMGCAHALLFLLSYWLLTSVPGPRAPDEEIAAFYRSGEKRRLVLAGLYVMPFAGIAFLWFSAALRAHLRFSSTDANEVFASVQFVSGILYVALFFAAAAASSVLAVSVEFSDAPTDPVVARLFPQYGATLLLGFAMRMAAMFVFTTSRLVRTTGALPRWFTWIGLVVGLFLLLSPSFSRALVLLFPGWLFLLCALLLVRASRPGRTTATTPPPAGRRQIVGVLVVAVVVAGAWLASTRGVRWWVDTRLDAAHERTIDIDLLDRSGKRWRSSDLRGRSVILSFFRSHCSGCLTERDAIVALAARLDPERAQLLSVMMDAVEGYAADVTAATLKQMNYRHPVVMADAAFLAQFQGTTWAHVTPITWILDRDGRIVRHLRGHQELPALLAALPEGAARR